MKYLKIIGAHLRTACIYFTAAQFIIAIGFQMTAGYRTESDPKGNFINFEIEIILILFSVVMAVIQDVFKIKKLSFAVRLLLHFLLTMIALFVLMLIIRGNQFRSVFLLLAAAAVVYAIGATVVIIIRIARRKKEDQNKDYKPMFKK